jgi:hypothetical protein
MNSSLMINQNRVNSQYPLLSGSSLFDHQNRVVPRTGSMTFVSHTPRLPTSRGYRNEIIPNDMEKVDNLHVGK